MNIDGLGTLLEMVQDYYLGFLFLFFRVGAVVSLVPVFGEQSIPVRVRLAIAFVMTSAALPIVGAGPSIELGPVGIALTIVQETAIGAVLGLSLRFLVFSLQTAGSIIAQSTSLSQIFGGSAGNDAQPAMGHILTLSSLALIATMDVHIQLLKYIAMSFEIVPVGSFPEVDVLTRFGIAQVSKSFELGFMFSAPFLLASLIYNVTLGVINKAMPQLMVAFVGAPAITAGGIALLFLSVPYILSLWSTKFGIAISTPFEVFP